jgi:hypothetical protein
MLSSEISDIYDMCGPTSRKFILSVPLLEHTLPLDKIIEKLLWEYAVLAQSEIFNAGDILDFFLDNDLIHLDINLNSVAMRYGSRYKIDLFESYTLKAEYLLSVLPKVKMSEASILTDWISNKILVDYVEFTL